MAREFDAGSSQNLERTISTLFSDWPWSASCWLFFRTGDAQYSCPSLYVSGDALSYEYLGFDGSGVYAASRKSVTVEIAAISTAAPSNNTWHHCGAVFASQTSRAAYLDGGNKGTDTDSADLVNPASWDRLSLGRIRDTSNNFFATGVIAEVGIWNVALTDADMALLAKGLSPLLMRRENLKGYWPLIGSYSPEIDLAPLGALPLTLTNGPTAHAHTRQLYPPPFRIEIELPPPLARDQEGYRWRDDDGDEDAASWLASQDTNITRAKDTNTRLRILVDIDSDPPSEALKLQYRKVGVGSWKDVTSG